MVAGDVTITRGVTFRDDFVDTALAAWTPDSGVTATSDGDILSLSGTTATNGLSRNLTGSPSSTTYPLLMVRGKGSGNIDIKVTYGDATTSTFTMALTSNYNPPSTFTLTTGKTISTVKFQNQSVGGTNTFDFLFIFKETLTLPAVSQPLQLVLRRRLPELAIPTREGGISQDMGSESGHVDLAGNFVTTTSPNNYTGDQWWDVLVGTWLEGNWQWLTSDRITYKFQIEELTSVQEPGRVGYYGFKIRLRKIDILSATAQTFGATQ